MHIFWNVSGTIDVHLISNITFHGFIMMQSLHVFLTYCIVFRLWRKEKTICLEKKLNPEVLLVMDLILNQKCYRQWLKGRTNNWWRTLTVNNHLKIILLIKTLPFEIAIPITANFTIFYSPNSKHLSSLGQERKQLQMIIAKKINSCIDNQLHLVYA